MPALPVPDLVLHPFVVDGRVAVLKIACQRLPALEAVVDGARRTRAVGHPLALRDQPTMQRLGDRLGAFLPYSPARIGRQAGHVAFDAVQGAEQDRKSTRLNSSH